MTEGESLIYGTGPARLMVGADDAADARELLADLIEDQSAKSAARSNTGGNHVEA